MIGACAIYNQDGSGSYYNAQFPSSAQLYEKLTSQLINTANELTSYLDGLYDSLGKNIMDIIGAVQARDTSLSDKDAKTIAQNILDRLATVGVQIGGINTDPGTKVSGYEGATVLNVRKGKTVWSTAAGHDFGTGYYSSTFDFIVRNSNRKLEVLSFGVCYTNGLQAITDPNAGKWKIHSFDHKEIDYTPYAN